jgi:hypothetical protein
MAMVSIDPSFSRRTKPASPLTVGAGRNRGKRRVLARNAGKEALNAIGPADRIESGRAFAASVRIQHGILGQDLRNGSRIARCDCRLKSASEPMALFARCRKARPAGLDMRAGASSELAASDLATTERGRHLGEVEAENIVQQEARPFQRGQPFEQQHQGHGNVVRKLACLLGIEGFVDQRLRQPLADVKFALRPGRFHAVEA